MVNEGSGGGGSDMYYTDYGSYAEIAVNAVGNTAEMPNPGVLSQLIAKSGGNIYHGDLYADYENDSMEAHNIDSQQIAKGLTGSNALTVNDLNRLTGFKDFDADLGGFVIKDRLWWYGAARHTVTGQRYPTLVDDVQDTTVPVYTGKGTYNLTSQHKLIGFYQHANKHQPDYLGAILIPGGRATSAIMHANTVWDSTFPTNVWKAEYNAVLSNALFLEVRTGQYHTVWAESARAPIRGSRTSATTSCPGGVYGNDARSQPPAGQRRAQLLADWMGRQSQLQGRRRSDARHLDAAVRALSRRLRLHFRVQQRRANPGVPLPGRQHFSERTMERWTVRERQLAAELDALTLNLGIRYDRQRAFLPAQQGPAGQAFAAVDSAVTWNNWGPRLGFSFDLTGDGKTVVKGSYGTVLALPRC